MHRCYVAPEHWSSGDTRLGPEEARHLLQVLRMEQGQHLEVFNGQGEVAPAELISVQDGQAVVCIGAIRQVPAPAVRYTLYQGLPRTQRMELIVQKAVELGFHRIVPLYTRHSLIRWNPDQAHKKITRWKRIALNAAKQCGNPYLLDIEEPLSFTDWAARGSVEKKPVFFGSLHGDARPLKAAVHAVRATAPSQVGCLVGPEGDFSREELETVHALGLCPVTLGPRVLRSETAALYMMTVITYEWTG